MELRKNADVERLKNLLYKKTRLEDTFGVNMLAISDGKPELLGLKDIIRLHTDFHYEVVTRKYRTLLDRLLVQKEIKEGLIQACDIIDLIIEILRGSKNLAEAKACLISGDTGNINFKTQKSKKAASKLSFTERQATAILETVPSDRIGNDGSSGGICGDSEKNPGIRGYLRESVLNEKSHQKGSFKNKKRIRL